MFTDRVVNTPELPVALLERVKIIEGQRIPSIHVLKSLASLCARTNWEYGVQVYETSVGGQQYKEATYVRGERDSIREPEKPEGASKGVFIHTHNNRRGLSINSLLHLGKPSWYMLPSDAGFDNFFERLVTGKAGDITAHLFSRPFAGYLNILSDYGVTLHIGVTGDSANDDLKDSQWEIIAGKQAGRVYETPRKLWMDHKSTPDSVMVWSERWPHSNSNFFLMLSWDRVSELTPVFTDLENLCFGDGVERVVQNLYLDVPHKKNLSDVAQISFVIKTDSGFKEY